VAAQTLRAQAQYLREIIAQYRHGKQDNLVYRLARRNAHNADAALSSALSAAFKEPASIRRHTSEGKRFLVLSHTLLNYLSALGAHRDARLTLAGDSDAARAVDSLLGTLDALAMALEAGQALPVAMTPVEAALLDALARSADEALPEAQRVLNAQLRLALRLLPQLREQAAGLVAAPGPGAAGGDAVAVEPLASPPHS
jgi:uncharacterized membrane protein YccC